MQNMKQAGFLAGLASMALLATMSFAQMGTGAPAPGQNTPMGAPGQPGAMGAPGAPGTAGYPGQAGTAGTMGNQSGQMGTNGGKMQDHTFMTKAAQGGLAEVQLGQLAQQNGQSQEVKDFGQRMVTDHTKANDQLKQVASQQGVNLPTSPSAKDKAEYDRLSKLQGEAFDKAYSKMMVSDHKKDVSEFKREADSGSDPQVKNFASETLPVLQEHLQMAEKMNGTEKSQGHGSKKSSSGSTASNSSQPQ